jgi:hypothetical protein
MPSYFCARPKYHNLHQLKSKISQLGKSRIKGLHDDNAAHKDGEGGLITDRGLQVE